MGQNIAADDQAVAAVELKRYVTLRMARGIDNAQTGDDLVPRLDRFDLIFDCSVVAPRARDEAGAFRRQAARCVCACPEIPFCGRDVELALSMPAALKLFQSFPAVGIKRSPDPMSTRIKPLFVPINVTFVGELYCSPVWPAALSIASRSRGSASGARKLVGKTRWPSLTIVTSKAPCLNE